MAIVPRHFGPTVDRNVAQSIEDLRAAANTSHADLLMLRQALAAQPPTHSYDDIRTALQSNGSHPLNLTGLPNAPVLNSIVQQSNVPGSSGIVVNTGPTPGPPAVVSRSLVAGTGIAITNPTGVSGNPAIAAAGLLASLFGVAGNGFLVQTAPAVATNRVLAAGTGIGIANPDGVAGNPVISATMSLSTILVDTTSNGTINNYNPGLSGPTLLEWAGPADAIVTGIAGGVTGAYLYLRNTGAHVMFLRHLNGGSLAANQLTNSITSGDTPVAPGGHAIYLHDATNWVLVEHGQGSDVAFPTVWSASPTNPVLGNGSLSCLYNVTGNRVWAGVTMVSGTTTTYGSGTWNFTVPYAAGSGSDVGFTFQAGAVHPLLTSFPTTATILATDIVSGNQVDATHPATWVVGTANQVFFGQTKFTAS